MFRHAKCNGRVLIASDILRLVSPGVRVSPDGLALGVSELQKIGSSKRGPVWICGKCGQEFLKEEELEEVEVECITCDKYHPVSGILTTQYGLFCGNCHDILSGNSTDEVDEYLANIRTVLDMRAPHKKETLSKLMLSPIKI